MLTPKLRKKYEKLVLELRYLTADYEYHRMAYADAQDRFATEFEEWRQAENLLSPSEHSPDSDADEVAEVVALEDEQTRRRVEVVANTLFKKIAKETHPDKLQHMTAEERERRAFMFQEAKEASIKREWYRLLCIATDLAIKLPTPSKEHIVLLESKNRELRDTIAYMQKTYAWVYSQMPNQASKANLFREFANTVGYIAAE